MGIEGKYQHVKSENLEEFMKAAGLGIMMRKIGSSTSPTMEVKIVGDDYQIKTTTPVKSAELNFKLGVPFKDSAIFGKDLKTVVTREGNRLTLIQTLESGEDIEVIRDFTDDGCDMTMTLTKQKIVAKRHYKKA